MLKNDSGDALLWRIGSLLSMFTMRVRDDRCLNHRDDTGTYNLGQAAPSIRNLDQVREYITNVDGQIVGNSMGISS